MIDYWLTKNTLDSPWCISKKKRKGISLEETCEYKTESVTYVVKGFKLFGNFDIKVGFLNFTCGTIKGKV